MANFNFYLNRQGVRGKKGDKGDQGFSPNISIKTDTPTEFIMTVNNEFDSFDTPNLIPTAVGEKVTELEATLTTHTQQITDLTTELEADKAIIEANTGDIENLQIKQREHTSRLEALDNQFFGIRKDVTQQAGWIGQLQVSDSDKTTKIADLQNNKQNKLVAGENITLTDNTDGTTTISSEGGGGSGELPDNVALTDIGNVFTDSTQSIAMEHYSHTGLTVGQKVVHPDGTSHVDLSKPTVDITGNSILFTGNEGGIFPQIRSTHGELDIDVPNLTISHLHPLMKEKLHAGDNISITEDDSGEITISSTASGSESEIDKVIESSSTTNSVVLTPKDGKTLDLSGAPMVAVGENLVNNIDGEDHQLYLKQGDVAAGENITVEKTATGITISSTGGSSTAPENMVTTDTVQDIEGNKTFKNSRLRTVDVNTAEMITLLGGNLQFKDGNSNTTTLEQKQNGLNISTNNYIQIIDGKPDHSIYINNKKINFDDLTDSVSLATTDVAGRVKPDGTTITIDDDGTIHAASGGGSIPDNVVTTDGEQMIVGAKTFRSSTGITSFGESSGSLYNSIQMRPDDNAITFYNARSASTSKIANRGYTASKLEVGTGFASVKVPVTLYDKNGDEILGGSGGGETPDLSNYAQLNTSTKQIFTGENVFNNTNTYIKSGGNIRFSGTGNAYRYGSISGAYDTLTLNAGGNAGNGKLELLGNIAMRGITRPTFNGSNIALVSDIPTDGGGSSVADQNGIEADYKIKHGIVDCPNGIITYSASNKDIVIKQGLVLNCAGNGSAKTTISADIPYTVGNSIPFTLFYAQGNLLECPEVYWQEEEPESNGQTGYQAWWNPNKETNPDQQWQFRSNDTGNVFRTVNSATPIADINAGADFITSVSYLGYRVMDDDILVDTNSVQTITARKIFRDGALFRSIMDSDQLAVNSKMVTGAKGTLHLSDTDGISLKTDTGIDGSITLDAENGNIEIYAGANKTLNVITANNSGMMVQESDNVILRNQSHSLHVNSEGLFVDGSNDKQVIDKSMGEYIGHQAMPSDKYIPLTIGASGTTYIAPADGYVTLAAVTITNDGYADLSTLNKDGVKIFASRITRPSQTSYVIVSTIVAKGGTVAIEYKNANLTSATLRFIYAIGSEPTV